MQQDRKSDGGRDLEPRREAQRTLGKREICARRAKKSAAAASDREMKAGGRLKYETR